MVAKDFIVSQFGFSRLLAGDDVNLGCSCDLGRKCGPFSGQKNTDATVRGPLLTFTFSDPILGPVSGPQICPPFFHGKHDSSRWMWLLVAADMQISIWCSFHALPVTRYLLEMYVLSSG